MIIHPRNVIALLLFVLVPLTLLGQLPASNPYTARYGTAGHWTNEIPWSKVTDARTVKGLIGNGNKVDSILIHRTIKKISASGGGVLYFPAGTYYLNYNLRLESGVVIRGDTPGAQDDARKEGFDPPTRFEFPKFQPSFTGYGTPHNVFRTIYGDTTGIKNAGLVDLNINRAVILFLPGGFYPVSTLQGDTYWCKDYHDNIIILGIRQNNAVVASPEVPNKSQMEKGKYWQRWPYPFIGNINLYISHNCVVANCRLNDAVTDDFEQPGYMDEFYSSFTGKEARFSYTDHPGICLNDHKIVSRGGVGDASGPWGPYGLMPYTQMSDHFKSLDSICEPELFAKGTLEVRDNYIRTSPNYGKINTITRAQTIIKDNMEVNTDSLSSIAYVNDRGTRSNYISTAPDILAHFEKKIWVSEKNDTLRYRFMRPEKQEAGKKYPLVLYLHPEDLFGKDNEKQLSFFIPKFCTPENMKQFPCYIIAPQERELFGAWVDTGDDKTLTRTLELAKLKVEEAIRNENVDKERIYVIGISRGGTGAWNLAAKYPETFAAVVTLDGLEHHFSKETVNALKDLAVWTAVPLQYGFFSLFVISRLNIVRLKREGGDTSFQLLDAWDRQSMINQVYKDPAFFPWLFSKRK